MTKKQAFENLLTGLGVSVPTRENMLKLFRHFGFSILFYECCSYPVAFFTHTHYTKDGCRFWEECGLAV